MACQITPISAFQSTNLNSKIDSFSRLGDRIVRSLGAPLISVEVHQDQLFENISIACEMFSKFAGYTKEYLVIDSLLYERGKGVRLDHLYTLSNPLLKLEDRVKHRTESPDTAPYILTQETSYIAISSISKTFFSIIPELSSAFKDGVERNMVFDQDTYNQILTGFSSNQTLSVIPASIFFTKSYTKKITLNGENPQETVLYNNMFDYDAMDYRKVIAVTDFEEGESSGINTLFTIEQTLAQQTYFSYAMGNYGFDLISWYTVKNWLETREKVLATRRSFEFDDRTQTLRIYPEPSTSVRFYGVISCYVEKPIRDIIKEAWVYQYALALTKINVGHVRGKFSGVNLFGGQAFTTDIMQQGLTEKEKLEQDLYTTSAAAASDPTIFFIG
jgi:hypothetical protein